MNIQHKSFAYILAIVALLACICAQAQTNTWLGSVDNDWHKPCNWSLNTVPDCNTDVVVPTSTVYPVITALGECRTLSITSAATNAVTLNSTGGGTLYVSSTNGGTCLGNPTVNGVSSAPVIGTITQPTCTVATGSVALSGLPSTGNWTVTGSPSGTLSGSGTTGTVSGLASGSYTFTVSINGGCGASTASTTAVINAAPVVPSAPSATITQPTCTTTTGTITINTQSNVTYSIDGSTYQVSNVFAGVAPGTYTIYVQSTSTGNCVASTTGQVVNSAPSLSAPVIGNITQPTCTVATGSVDLSGLPATGSWTITGSPSGSLSGSGSSATISGLAASTTFTFTVTQGGCTSSSSSSAVINAQPTGSSGSQTFSYTGGVQTFTVSSNVCATTISIDIAGAQGGTSYMDQNCPTLFHSPGGMGGRVQCTSCITVTPGQLLDIYVGGMGGNGNATNVACGQTPTGGASGYNGGGRGDSSGIHFAGAGGGGGSDIRTHGGGFATRLAVAGGGGGGGGSYTYANTNYGGPGGAATSAAGAGEGGGTDLTAWCGQGGTTSAGGAGATTGHSAGEDGILGVGGPSIYDATWGGGGLYGGGAVV